MAKLALVVDAAQGVEAQTLANVYLALENNLEIIPVLNKVDLPTADPEGVKKQIEDTVGLDCSGIIHASAKEKLGIGEILEAIIEKVPPPKADRGLTARALIFDSWFDAYQGVVVLVRAIDGTIKKGDRIKFMATDKDYEVLRMGKYTPFPEMVDVLEAGEVGFIICGIKDIRDVQVGDTVTSAKSPATQPLAGFQRIKPMVFAGIFPVVASEYQNLKDALDKLCLNDSSLTFEIEKSLALGFGYRCGFLGLLHMEIVQERLEREFDMDLITTAPTVIYEVLLRDGKVVIVDNPSKMPDPSRIEEIREPIVDFTIFVPQEYVGTVMTLCTGKRGVQIDLAYHGRQVHLRYELPLA